MPVLIVMVGFNGSGKTTIAKKLEKDLGISIVSGDPLRLMIKKEILYYRDFDISIPTEKGRLTRKIVHDYRTSMSYALLSQKQSVIYDSNALLKDHRKQIIESSIKDIKNVTTVILWLQASEEEILNRLAKRGENNWQKMYLKHKKPIFEPPSEDECENLLIYNQDNYEEIRNRLLELT